MRIFRFFCRAAVFVFLLASCRGHDYENRPNVAETGGAVTLMNFGGEREKRGGEFASRLSVAMRAAELPAAVCRRILETQERSGDFARDLGSVLAGPAYLRVLVDGNNPLPQNYSPPDLVPLAGTSYRENRKGLTMRRSAALALEKMAKAAAADGITLLVASAYRSYDYQIAVHNRYVEIMGRAAAERISARPGYSQHQTGLAVDFHSSIDNSFARTPAGHWMESNAPRFGWSPSYPQDYEQITGHSWESWHFRYLGKELADFTERYFGGIQQFALRFLHEWENPREPD